MKLKTTLAVCAAAVGLLFAVPQGASALPAAKDVSKQATQSNVEKTGTVCLLPVDSDASARRIYDRIFDAFGARAGVIVSDSFGRPWREGIVNFAIGCAGMLPLLDYTGQSDPAGYELRVTAMAVVDELAAAAELVHARGSHPRRRVHAWRWRRLADHPRRRARPLPISYVRRGASMP